MVKFPISSSLSRLESALASARNYEEWRELAGRLDEVSGANKWKASADSEHFDANQISARYRRMKDCLDKGDYEELLFTLNEGIPVS